MTRPQSERQRLYRRITAGEDVPVLVRYAEDVIFPDITIMEWCQTLDVRVHTESVGTKLPRSDGKPNLYTFYVFSISPEADW